MAYRWLFFIIWGIHLFSLIFPDSSAFLQLFFLIHSFFSGFSFLTFFSSYFLILTYTLSEILFRVIRPERLPAVFFRQSFLFHLLTRSCIWPIQLSPCNDATLCKWYSYRSKCALSAIHSLSNYRLSTITWISSDRGLLYRKHLLCHMLYDNTVRLCPLESTSSPFPCHCL